MQSEHKEAYDSIDSNHNEKYTSDIKKALQWFLEYMGGDNWLERRKKVIDYFSAMNRRLYIEPEKYDVDSDQVRMAFYEDWVAWYLYLAESLADRPAVDEPGQSSRIWPFFATIGKYNLELKKVKGIDVKLHDLLKKRINQPDSILFELVVAACYLKNGWTVEFIPETGKGKTPDLFVTRGEQKYFVECKRLAKVTEYSEEERCQWIKRWRAALPFLIRYPHSVFLDVEFKVEVAKTDVGLVAKAFHDMASSGAVEYGFCVENKQIKVCAKHIDMRKIHDHLDKWMVKYPSPQLHALFDENYDPQGSYTSACIAKLVEVSPDSESVINIFADKIDKVCCAKWECTAIESIDKKAKDVKGLLVKAVNQAPKNGSTIIHIGYETLHGPHIEYVRDEKIVDLISSFDFGEKNIASIFCHSFQSRLFGGDKWDFAETTRYFGVTKNPNSILSENFLMDREGSVKANETHWSQDMAEYLRR
ncbi:hypothetical protein ACET9Z_09660 [Aeromonas veronii]|uniref:hypothetical protein n=1 Tax=Aeromonas veronii TaxID=654 RepID=UPI0038E89700